MAALLPILIPALIDAGVQLAPIVAGLITTESHMSQPGRADVSDADLAAVRKAIVDLQARINAA